MVHVGKLLIYIILSNLFGKKLVSNVVLYYDPIIELSIDKIPGYPWIAKCSNSEP